jgi:hypothetical protein
MRRRGTHIDYWWDTQKERITRKTNTQVGDNIEMDLGEIRWGGVDWIYLAEDRDQWRAHVNMVMNLWVPYKMLGTGGLSNNAQAA